jgi:hypothetical protein
MVLLFDCRILPLLLIQDAKCVPTMRLPIGVIQAWGDKRETYAQRQDKTYAAIHSTHAVHGYMNSQTEIVKLSKIIHEERLAES